MRGSFIPPWPIRQLRDLTGQRTLLPADRPRQIQQLEKLIEPTGIKYSSVAVNVLGVSERTFLEALIAGENNPVPISSAKSNSFRERGALRCVWFESFALTMNL